MSKIDSCVTSGCGWACCKFQKDGHIIALPNELESANLSTTHLEILENNYNGGKKIRCLAENTETCDNGYKPIQCRIFPLFVRAGERLEKSNRCPLSQAAVLKTVLYVKTLLKDYASKNNSLENFLDSVWLNNYSDFPDLSILTEKNYEEVKNLDLVNNDTDYIFSSDIEIIKCLSSGLSVGVFKDNILVGMCLAYLDEYGFCSYIDKIIVDKKFRGNKWSYSLLTVVIDCIKDSTKAVNIISSIGEQNHASIKCFTYNNFVKVRHIQNFYGKERILYAYEIIRDKK